MSAATYEVRVAGLLSRDAVANLDLGEARITCQEMRTVLSGTFVDQAALYGFLHRLRAFGLDVVEVRRVRSEDDADVEEQA